MGAWARPCKSASARTALFGSESWPASTNLNLSRVTARSDDGCRCAHEVKTIAGSDPGGKVKSISSETTLDKDTAELDRLRPILWQLTETVARRLKKADLAGKGITLKLKTSDFRIVTRSKRLKSATQSEEEMFPGRRTPARPRNRWPGLPPDRHRCP